MEEKYVEFTKEMRDEGYTILCPTMLPLHFEILISCPITVMILPLVSALQLTMLFSIIITPFIKLKGENLLPIDFCGQTGYS